MVSQRKPRGATRGFLFSRLVVFIISVQPFAYVVGNYTRHDRGDKVEKVYHGITPFLSG